MQHQQRANVLEDEPDKCLGFRVKFLLTLQSKKAQTEQGMRKKTPQTKRSTQ